MSQLSSSTSSLSDVETLKQKLEEKEELLRTAGQYGMDLLAENKELSKNLVETEKNYSKTIEKLEEKNYSLAQKIEQKTRMESDYQEEIDNLKRHLASQRDELNVLSELADQSNLIMQCRERLREMELNSDKLEIENGQLKSLITSYEHRLDEADEKLKEFQTNLNETASDEMTSVLIKLNEANTEKENLQHELVMKENEMFGFVQQLETSQSRLVRLQEDLDDANIQLNKMSNSFMAATQENQELRCEIDILRTQDRDHKQKGNSMFTELDDKRQEAEKKLLLLTVKHESLQNQHDLSKKQMNKLKMQMSNVLRMASGQVDSTHVSELENQLHEARAEIQSLSTKLAKQNVREDQRLLTSADPDDLPVNSHRTLVFADNLLKKKDEELMQVNKELQERRLRSAYESQQLNESQQRLREMESRANKLHAQNIKLSVKLEEMRVKYKEEDPQSDVKIEKSRKEEIPNFNAEMGRVLLNSNTATCQFYDSHHKTNELSDHQVQSNDDCASSDTTNVLSDIDNTTQSEIPSSQSSSTLLDTVSPAPEVNRTPGHLTTRHYLYNRSYSKDSLMSGDSQVNAKCYDDTDDNHKAQKKVIDVGSGEQNPDQCTHQ